MTEAPLLAVSVLNWNTPQATLDCLASLYSSTYENFRVIVVDNASADDSAARIAAAFPAVRLIVNAENRGYAGGHAAALRQAQEWGAAALLLLNSDAEVEAQTLHELMAAWREHGDALYGGAPLCRRGDAVVLNFPQKYLQPDGRPRPWRRDRAVPWSPRWNAAQACRVGAAAGSCLLLPLALVQKHGWLDGAWFLYCEEIDYCYRLRDAGVASWLVPRARLWHAGGGSQRDWPALRDGMYYYHARNEIELARRHAGTGVAALVALKKLGRALLLAPRRPARAACLLRGVFDVLRGRMGKVVAPEALLPARRAVPAQDGGRPAPAAPGGAASSDDGAAAAAEAALSRLRRSALRGALRRRWLALWPGSRTAGAVAEPAGASWLIYAARPAPFLREYHDYCVALFRLALRRRTQALRLCFGDVVENDVSSTRQAHRIAFQWEHTLVRPGGRDSAGAVAGTVPTGRGEERYLVRIAGLERLLQAAAVIDYSRQNLAHIAAGGRHGDYLARCVAIAPLLYAPDFAAAARPLPLLATFADPRQPRRAVLLRQARARSLPLRNVRGIWDGAGVGALYRASRVLLNVHQTGDHHTLEELRVLPALLKGVIVVSEDVPLREAVPYHEFIVWAAYDDLLETARGVLDDYAAVHARLFGDGRLQRLIAQLQADNAAAVEQVLRRLG
ncbi:glycosyltransferase family 2 protein [Tahibacter harae]|uniref:Glycosyltransferase family 2 protein n=1 Tax=Tahibacter harae TaxID=2963937 RepID=A0ABT1QM71_9GAMM|nr:glycosyltransferase family 2 protein [Tahibacter harae]MCQ4163636.1 glycosyltransferase family 2 protein [Tahibacter harae]